MNSIQNILSSSKNEIRYQWYSKILLITIIITVAVSLLNIYGLKTKAESSYDLYQRTYNLYKDEGVDVEYMLTQPINVIENEDSQTIDNPVRYRFEEAVKSIQLLENKSLITQTLEWMTFVFFPLIFAVFAIYLTTYDYKYQTIKIKAIFSSSSKLLLSKLISICFGVLVIFLTTIIVSYLVGIVFYNDILSSVSNSQFTLDTNYLAKSNVFIQLLFSFLTCFLFAMIGVFLGVLFKSALVPVIIFFVCDLILPILTKYDIRNIISVIAHTIFDFEGRFQLFKPTKLPLGFAYLFISIFLFVVVLFSFYIFKRQSKYYSTT